MKKLIPFTLCGTFFLTPILSQETSAHALENLAQNISTLEKKTLDLEKRLSTTMDNTTLSNYEILKTIAILAFILGGIASLSRFAYTHWYTTIKKSVVLNN